MGPPFEPLGIFGVVGIVTFMGAIGIVVALGVIGPTRVAKFFSFRPQQAITDEQQDFTYRQITSDLESASLAPGSVLSQEEAGPSRTGKDVERLEADLLDILQQKRKGTGKVTRQAEDVERLEADLLKLLQQKSGQESEVARLRRALSSAEEAATEREQLIHKLSAENQQRLEVIKRMRTSDADSEQKSEVSRLRHALSSAEEAASEREQFIHELSAKNQQQLEVIKRMRTTNTDSEQISTLLPPPKADNISVAEVADLVTVLNAQIEQTSSLLLDSLFDQESPGTGKELEIVWDELNDYIGTWLCNDLKRRSKEHIVEPDPLIMHLTLQTGLVNACSRIINDWNPPFWIDGLVFSRTYSSIEKTNGQAAADAWRALSRTHMTVLQSERQEANKRFLTEVLLRLITAVGGSSESAESLVSQYNEKVEDIVKKAVGLHKTISEDVTSMELITYTSPSDTQFDGSQMEDTEGDESESGSGRVVCTVDMGLRCRKRNESRKQIGSGEEWGVTMKSRVVLDATLAAY